MFGISDNQNQPEDVGPVGSSISPPSTHAPIATPSPSAEPTDEAPAPNASPASHPEPAEMAYELSPAPHQTQTSGNPVDDDLLEIKQQALQSLTPLVDQLEQNPEEKFKTTMMLIQASDNSGLIKQAYEAASQIADEKARAQALIDIINEINYFTHQEQS